MGKQKHKRPTDRLIDRIVADGRNQTAEHRERKTRAQWIKEQMRDHLIPKSAAKKRWRRVADEHVAARARETEEQFGSFYRGIGIARGWK
jgi:hypothetical protein